MMRVVSIGRENFLSWLVSAKGYNHQIRTKDGFRRKNLGLNLGVVSVVTICKGQKLSWVGSLIGKEENKVKTGSELQRVQLALAPCEAD